MSLPAICVLFGGVSPEHEVSLRSAKFVIENIDRNKYQVYTVGITKAGRWLLYSGDTSALPDGSWERDPNNVEAVISPSRGDGLLVMREGRTEKLPVACVFPVLHGENGEDGSVQGLMQLSGIPCVGPGVGASAAAMDKTMTKLVADAAGVRQAAWQLVRYGQFRKNPELEIVKLSGSVKYPVFVKPAGTGSSVGVTKAADTGELLRAIEKAGEFDDKVLVEEFIEGQEVEVAVLGNEEPVTSGCGEIDSGADFYDYEAKYISDSAKLYIPARISDESSDAVRAAAAVIYKALGCRGLSRVDFFVLPGGEPVFNEINTIPGFTSISMYPKLFEAAGVNGGELVDRLIDCALASR